MLSCKEAAALMSQELDRPLNWREKIGLRMHVLICTGCSNARQQLEFIRRACRSWSGRDD